MNKLIAWIFTGLIGIAVSGSAFAFFHNYRINEIYSNADGSIQYIELLNGPVNGENFSSGVVLSIAPQGGSASNTFTFPSNLPSSATANTSVLIATQGFANLGIVTPDFIIPSGFLFINGGTIDLGGFDSVAYPALPTDGILSMNRTGVTGVNSPRNFAGATGTISPPTDTQAPTVPTGLSATAVSASQINLTWSASADNVGVTGYKVYRGGAFMATLGNVTSYSNTGLSASIEYSYTVSACDAAGNCSAQSASASAITIVPTVPGAPANVTATPGDTTATVSFTAPGSNGGAAITSYTVTSSPGGITASGSASPIVVTGLTNGVAYTFTVSATNSLGTGAASAPSNSLLCGCVFPPLGLASGFNLLGNSLTTALDVMTVFGNQTSPVGGITDNIASVWKWDAAKLKWQFHSPLLSTASNAAYALAHNYDVLTSIAAGEGYWVNALTTLNLPAQTGAAFSWNSFSFANLPSGFNLIAHAGTVTPSQFNANISTTPPGVGVVATDNFASLWAWDVNNVTWFFYSPLLESSGGLAAVKSYADSHNFQHFQDFNKTIDIGVGFWVNKF